jgi:hypothetical protein
LKDFRRKVEDVLSSLKNNATISEVIGIPIDLFAVMPRSISQVLGKAPETVTFRDLAVTSEYGLRRKDTNGADDDVIARVSAARVTKWLERLVLPGQDILVDAPHLVSRFPSVLNVESPRLSDWNNTATLKNDDKVSILSATVRTHRATNYHWFSRPIWFWPRIVEDTRIAEVKQPWGAKQAAYVFCEDDSRFHKEQECHEFVADTESPFSRRFVKRIAGVEYRPAVRFSM